MIDGFLQDVCLNLVNTGQSHAKAIILKSNGSWTVKKEDDNASEQTIQRQVPTVGPTSRIATPIFDKASLKRPYRTANKNSTAQSDVIEVVDLDGD